MTAEWLDGQLAGAPEALVARTRAFAGQSPCNAEGLSVAAAEALGAAIAAGNERRGALDLLAADALVTLALAARNEVDPAGLSQLARSLLDSPTRV